MTTQRIVGTLQTGYLTYMLQAKTKEKACVHALPRATLASESASLFMEGSDAATCTRLRTPPLCLGGLRHCHVPRGSGPHLTVQEGSDAATRPSAPDPTLPLRRGPALTHVLRFRTAPASEMGSGVDTYPMALHRPWAVEIKEGLAAMVCSEAHVFPRHVRALPKRLQDMLADDVL
jgi:hypothetical protein